MISSCRTEKKYYKKVMSGKKFGKNIVTEILYFFHVLKKENFFKRNRKIALTHTESNV